MDTSNKAQFATRYDLPTPEPDSPSLSRSRKPYAFSTLCATVENPDSSHKDQHGSSSVPIYQTATFKGVGGEYDYSRSGNPTRTHLEHHIAKISSAQHAFAVSSGMAALDIITRLLKPGSEVIAGDDIYGGTNRLLTYIRTHMGVTVHHIDTTKTESIIPYLKPGKTAMVLLETPTNPLLKIIDIASISATVKERCEDAVVVVDNTMMSPYLQRPLEHGADIVYDSATKYLSGHHDLMAGVITCNRDDLAQQMAFIINSVGNALTPFDSFLLLRGIKTLAVRMDRQQSSAMLVAQMLSKLGFVTHYPGLPGHPNKEVHERVADGYGAVLSFETGDKELSERIVGATRLWGISVSFGCVNSLISMPCVMSHASIDPATRAERGLPEDVIRLCVGIEDPSDLLDDLQHALLEAGAITIAANDFVRIPNAVNKAVEKLADMQPRDDNLDRNREWFVSAPGKVILFGEHAVVHGVTAVAASVDLRCYALSSPRNDKKISVRLTNVGDHYHEWNIDDLPWDAASPVPPGEAHADTLDQHLLDAIVQRSLPPADDLPPKTHGALLAFLYMYMSISHTGPDQRPSFHFQVRSTLPVGAGLGSSAAYSTCIATVLLLLNARIGVPPLPARSRSPAAPDDPGHIHVSHQGRRAIAKDSAEEVNRWAFVSEKVLHGNPSGVDNSVSVFGGALAYTRPGFARKSGMDAIQGFKSLKFLLVDSKIPRDTKKIVAGVAAKKMEEPEVVQKLLDAIQSIVDEARRALADPELSRADLLLALSKLIDENHAHLISLGVSHEALEAIRRKTAAQPYELSTKLTGAGGGGCAVTLVPDDFRPEHLQELIAALIADDFQPYVTAVGGSGAGILSPYKVHRNVVHKKEDPITPPETPTPEDSAEHLAFIGSDSQLTSEFSSTPHEDFAHWAESQGRWMYV
ncbi:cystathionine beta-lyase [Steccherinum ochraceum]|uniref:Cystathionine beta-lyase n=1 Tax=Steccherinum ochraceum TaxID=92696 RepID=A0A4R0RFU6_9APHY|nr:cystathionine beta-lyase [Steccherinum ochraceum]